MFLLAVWNFMKENKVLWLVLGGVLLFVAGAFVGHSMVPPKTLVTEKLKEVQVDKVVVQTKTDVKIVKIHDSQQDQKIHRTIVEGINPPGCRSKTTTEDINVDTVVHDNTHDVEVRYVDKVVEKWQDRIVEKEKLVLNQPNWSVYAGLGLDIASVLGQGQHGIPGMNGIVVQAGVDRRIIGPFYIGIFGNTEGVVGLNLRATW